MTGDNSQTSSPSQTAAAVVGGRRRSPWPLAIIAALFIIMPFLAWYGTWFGRALSDEDIEEYLKAEAKPRHVQHALSQIAGRMERGDTGVRRWYQQIAALAASPVTDVRMTAAWVMGGDNTAEDFRTALVRLLEDREPIVRRNAALALVRFGDARGRAELRAMLRPFTVTSPVAGRALTVLSEGSAVNRESLLARLTSGDGQTHEVRAPLPGKIMSALVQEGREVPTGGDLFVLAPHDDIVWESLRALYLVGESEDLEDVERYARGVEGMSERIKKQATLTADAIKRRGVRPRASAASGSGAAANPRA